MREHLGPFRVISRRKSDCQMGLAGAQDAFTLPAAQLKVSSTDCHDAAKHELSGDGWN